MGCLNRPEILFPQLAIYDQKRGVADVYVSGRGNLVSLP